MRDKCFRHYSSLIIVILNCKDIVGSYSFQTSKVRINYPCAIVIQFWPNPPGKTCICQGHKGPSNGLSFKIVHKFPPGSQEIVKAWQVSSSLARRHLSCSGCMFGVAVETFLCHHLADKTVLQGLPVHPFIRVTPLYHLQKSNPLL